MRGKWAIPAVLVILVGCGDDGDPAPEIKHCRASLGWMTKGIGTVDVVDHRLWDQGDVRNVTLRYDLDTGKGGAGGPSRHFIQCRYDAVTAEGKHRVWANAVIMNGTPLSAQQVRTINVTISLMGERRPVGE